MAKFVHQLASSGSYMLRGPQTLDRIFLMIGAGSELDVYIDKDIAAVNTSRTPLYLKVNPSNVTDTFCNVELGIPFAAGTVFYVEGFVGSATLVFS